MAREQYSKWGIPLKSLGWTHEDGTPFDPATVYPAVDPLYNRVYAIDREDESNVRVFHSYHRTAQPGAAISISEFIWGRDWDQWPQPDVENRVVKCLGAPACEACIESGVLLTSAPATDWRLAREQTLNETSLYAHVIENAGDPLSEHMTDRHLVGEVEYVYDEEDDSVMPREVIRKIISLYGPIYDIKYRRATQALSLMLDIHPTDDEKTQELSNHPIHTAKGPDFQKIFERIWSR